MRATGMTSITPMLGSKIAAELALHPPIAMSPRTLTSLLLALLALGLMAGCGGDSADRRQRRRPVARGHLDGGEPIMGRLSLALGLESEGGTGAVTAKITGPLPE